MNDNSKKMFDYRLSVNGIFGRNRNPKRQSVRLVRSETQKTLDEVRPLAMAALADLKPKAGLRWLIAEYPIEVGDGFESFMLYSETMLDQGQVE